jgi:hypothetical protein
MLVMSLAHLPIIIAKKLKSRVQFVHGKGKENMKIVEWPPLTETFALTEKARPMPRYAQRCGMHAWTMFQPQLSVSVQWWQKAPGRLAHSLVNCSAGWGG